MRVLNKLIAGVFSLSLFFISCKNQGGGRDNDSLIVSLDPRNNELSHENVMEFIDWIEIKADSSIFIGNPDKIEVLASDYYILDTKNQKCVLRYSSDGTLKNKIGQLGDGPEEYPSIIDFTINRTSKRIFILSYESTIYIYSLDGTFERKVILNENIINKLACNPKGLMTTSSYSSRTIGSDAFLLTEYNRDFKPIEQWFSFSQSKRPPLAILGGSRLMTYGEYTYYFEDINLDIISYDCESNHVNTLMSFDLKNQMPEKFFSDNMRFISEQLNYNWVKDFVITDNNVIIGYIYDGKFSMSVLDRKGKVLASGQYHGPFPHCYPIDENIIVSPIEVDIYLNYWKNQSGIKQPSFPITEDTNLLLVKWKIPSHIK